MMNKEERKLAREKKLQGYNPDDSGLPGSVFGLPFTEEESEIILLPVPWEVTVSYRAGTAMGPDAIRTASVQIDLYDPINPLAWKKGIFMQHTDDNILNTSNTLREKTAAFIENIHEVDEDSEEVKIFYTEINSASEKLNEWVEKKTEEILGNDKFCGLIGGEHSVPLGYLRALAKRHDAFGILHIDAHADLRKAYEGFTYSHASIYYNAVQIPQVNKLVQVGIRDFSYAENELAATSDDRIVMHTSYNIRKNIFKGKLWQQQCEDIIASLPDKVYISFDIDGLEPWLCPNTGTPVPGGFSFEEAVCLLEVLKESGKKIIGFDLCEVAPSANSNDEWDGNVGARILYKLCQIVS